MKIPEIASIDVRFGVAAKQRWDSLIKPRGSLGRLEDVVVRLCEIQQTRKPDVARKKLFVFAGDHGVVAENVTAYPQSVTREMVRGFLGGYAAIGILARSGNIELEVVDAGICEPLSVPGIVSRRAGSGTRNFALEPAMTVQQVEFAVSSGIEIAQQAAASGIQLLAGGDMGIGNTTSASLLYSTLFKLDPSDVTGHGAGITEEGRQHKIRVIQKALNRWNGISANPLEILRQFGGFEIAELAGFYIGGAASRVAVVIDGFICGAAAAIAIALEPRAADYFFFAHRSAETGTAAALQKMGVKPLLDLNLRLGEGTGAALAMRLMDDAVHLYNEMPTFEQAEVSDKIL